MLISNEHCCEATVLCATKNRGCAAAEPARGTAPDRTCAASCARRASGLRAPWCCWRAAARWSGSACATMTACAVPASNRTSWRGQAPPLTCRAHVAHAQLRLALQRRRALLHHPHRSLRARRRSPARSGARHRTATDSRRRSRLFCSAAACAHSGPPPRGPAGRRQAGGRLPRGVISRCTALWPGAQRARRTSQAKAVAEQLARLLRRLGLACSAACGSRAPASPAPARARADRRFVAAPPSAAPSATRSGA